MNFFERSVLNIKESKTKKEGKICRPLFSFKCQLLRE